MLLLIFSFLQTQEFEFNFSNASEQMVSNYILNITPNEKMFKILQALKYEKHSYGSSFKIGFLTSYLEK